MVKAHRPVTGYIKQMPCQLRATQESRQLQVSSPGVDGKPYMQIEKLLMHEAVGLASLCETQAKCSLRGGPARVARGSRTRRGYCIENQSDALIRAIFPESMTSSRFAPDSKHNLAAVKAP